MKVISIGTGTNIFDPNSSAYRRVVEYGKIFEELHIIVFAPADRFTNQKLAPNVFLYPTNSKFELLYIFDYLRVVKSILSKTGNRDVVFSTQDPFETGLVGLWLKLKYGLPLHIQLHTDFANRYYWTHSLINFVRFLLAHFTLPFADGVRCVSKKIAEDVQELNPNVSVLPISQDFILTNDLVDSKEFKGRLLTVCRLEKEKNLTVAIKAFALLNKKFPESIFTIVGDGSQKKELMKLADSLGLATKVIFVGWQNNTEDFYKNADAYISTSLFEGYGISLMEAALNGLPLVVSEAGIARDYFGDEGALICKPNDIQAFYLSLDRVFSNSQFRTDLSVKGKGLAQAKVTKWSDYLGFYQKDIERVVRMKVSSAFWVRLSVLIKKIIDANKMIRFVIAGGTVAITQIGVLYVLTETFGLWYLASSVCSFIYAIIASFYLQKYWAFRDTQKSRAFGQFLQFVGVAILGGLINTASMYFWVEWVGLWYILSQFITGFIIAIVNFLIYRFIIFKK